MLEAFEDEAPHNYPVSELVEFMARYYDEDISEMSSADKSSFRQKVTDAKNYLMDHKLLSNPSKNTYMITPKGSEVLAGSPDVIDDEYLASLSGITGTEPASLIPDDEPEDFSDDEPLTEEIPEDLPDDAFDSESEDLPDDEAGIDLEPEPEPEAELDIEPTPDATPTLSPAPEPDPTPAPEPTLAATPAPTPNPTPAPAPATEPTPAPAITPQPEPTPGPTPTPTSTLPSKTPSVLHDDIPETSGSQDIEEVLAQHNTQLADQILARTSELSQDSFEMFVIDMLSKMGYRAFQNARYTTEASGSEFIHGVILEDKAGLTPIYIHARKLTPGRTVGRADIQDFVEAIADKGGKGIFATTGGFSEQAVIAANDERIMLIDGTRLANLMITHNFCVNVEKVFEVKAINDDSFREYED